MVVGEKRGAGQAGGNEERVGGGCGREEGGRSGCIMSSNDYENALFAFEQTIKDNVKKRLGRHECNNTILWVYEDTCGKGVAQSHQFIGMLQQYQCNEMVTELNT